MEDLFNYAGNSFDGASFGGYEASEVIKAMEAGLKTGMQYDNEVNSGGGLKVESLDSVLKVLTNRLDQLVYLNEMPKQKIDNTVHQYNQLSKYGEEVGIFNAEGETPEETDSQYIRRSVIAKFTGVTGQVTHPAMLVKLAGGMKMYTREVQNKTLLLQTMLDRRIVDANSACVPEQFDGVFRQHMTGVVTKEGGTLEGMSSEAVLDAYYNDPAVRNADGSILTDSLVEDAANVIVNVYNGEIDRIVSNPIIFNDYVKKFHESKRVLVGYPNSVVGATMGQSVNDIVTQFGRVNIKNDRFFDERKPKLSTAAASSAKAPVAVTKTADAAPVDADAKTQFTNHAGTYQYMVTAKNRFGESAPVLMSTAAIAVGATQSVDLQFAAGTGGAYAPTCFVIYRTVKNATINSTTQYYPIFEVSVTELAAGYDGAAATKVRDRNRIIAGTKSALIYYNSAEINEYLQFADTMKMDFAITAPSRRFAILNYGTPILYQPAKIVRIVNIGKEGL